MKRHLTILGLALFACLAPTAFADERAEVKKILLIYTPPDHPYGTHMYEHECRLLAKCLEQTPGVKAVVSQGWPKDAGMLDGVSCVAIYSGPAGEMVLGEANRSRFMELMKSGVGYVAMHWATADSRGLGTGPITEPYIGVLGGCFNFSFVKPPLAVTQERLVLADADHPICRGWAAYDLRDEWYLSMKFHEKAKPLLKVTVRADEKGGRPQTDLTVAWTFEREGHNGGRSFGATVGHFHDNFGVEAFRRMMVQGILWASHVEIPTLGAPVAVEDSDLILPPPPPPPTAPKTK